MRLLRAPLPWVLLAFGLWLNSRYNYGMMEAYGVEAVTTPMLFKQAFIGSATLIGIVCLIAWLRGEQFELYNSSDPGKFGNAAIIIVAVLGLGFFVNFALNRDLLFFPQDVQFAGERWNLMMASPVSPVNEGDIEIAVPEEEPGFSHNRPTVPFPRPAANQEKFGIGPRTHAFPWPRTRSSWPDQSPPLYPRMQERR